MRIWDCDPRMLSDRHLLGEHRELHIIERGGWPHHPESRRFMGRWPLLRLRHAALVIAMGERFASGDQSPIAGAVPWPESLREWEEELVSWKWLVGRVGYPPTALEHGTPWERDAVPKEWYLEHRRDWSWALVYAFHGVDGPPEDGRFFGSRRS